MRKIKNHFFIPLDRSAIKRAMYSRQIIYALFAVKKSLFSAKKSAVLDLISKTAGLTKVIYTKSSCLISSTGRFLKFLV
ncbi:hypothetical protein Aazo_5258 (plasmid) ['Nostoc azollae' 0708]|jgi:hypothetical protein|uniref:Uncharacterized protein n=1 Tax=Nostoc azollae (strain 0708) TaxID=551115 RepID=D7E5L2_NOSA0|nr:hypothetical protein Aazo_5258 ['Nostoc azollae' 0708]